MFSEQSTSWIDRHKSLAKTRLPFVCCYRRPLLHCDIHHHGKRFKDSTNRHDQCCSINENQLFCDLNFASLTAESIQAIHHIVRSIHGSNNNDRVHQSKRPEHPHSICHNIKGFPRQFFTVGRSPDFDYERFGKGDRPVRHGRRFSDWKLGDSN